MRRPLRVILIACWCIAIGTLLVGWLSMLHLHAMPNQHDFVTAGQSPVDWAINELSRRVTLIEAEDFQARVSKLEGNVTEITWWLRSIAMAVLGQLFYMAFGDKMARRRERSP